MSKSFFGSINIAKILELVKSKSPAIYSTDGNPLTGMLNISIYINDTEDKYGNIGTITVKNKETGQVVYIGNFKQSTFADKQESSVKQSTPTTTPDFLKDFLNS